MKVLFMQVSQNAKTGPIPVSIIERASCWSGCALYEHACYAETGALAMHWDRVSRGSAGMSWSEFCTKVRLFGQIVCGAMLKQATFPDTAQSSTVRSSSKRSVRGPCRWAPIGAIISGWRIKQNKCPLAA